MGRASGSCTSCGATSFSDAQSIHLLHMFCKYCTLVLHIYLTERRIISTQELVKVDGQKLQKLRERRLWLIGHLAEKSGVHRNTISKLENGRGGAHPETIRKLADTLDVDHTELLGE